MDYVKMFMFCTDVDKMHLKSSYWCCHLKNVQCCEWLNPCNGTITLFQQQTSLIANIPKWCNVSGTIHNLVAAISDQSQNSEHLKFSYLVSERRLIVVAL